MKEDTTLKQQGGMDKIDRYKWTLVDVPGELKWIPKTMLEVDSTYQRAHSVSQVRELASKWSWTACGVIVVGLRDNNNYVVIDGQHRVQAALNRSDITSLPCIVFKTSSTEEEAMNFVRTNTNRRNVNPLDKFKANIVAKDETALYLDSVFKKYGLKVTSHPHTPKSINSIVRCYNMAKTDKKQFETVIEFLLELCNNDPIYEHLIGGIDYLSKNIDVGFSDSKLRQRILKFRVKDLMYGINDSIAHRGNGGAKVWAIGILEVINNGLHNKYRFKDEMVL